MSWTKRARGSINAMTRPPDVKEIYNRIETIPHRERSGDQAQDYENGCAFEIAEQYIKDRLVRIVTGVGNSADEPKFLVHRGRDQCHRVKLERGAADRMAKRSAEIPQMEEGSKQQVIGPQDRRDRLSKR